MAHGRGGLVPRRVVLPPRHIAGGTKRLPRKPTARLVGQMVVSRLAAPHTPASLGLPGRQIDGVLMGRWALKDGPAGAMRMPVERLPAMEAVIGVVGVGIHRASSCITGP